MEWLCETEIWKKAKQCYIDTGSFIVYVNGDDISQGIAEAVETR